MTKTKTDERTATATDGTLKSRTQPATIADSDVALRAYDFYLARGCEHGHDVEDWLRAEGELRSPLSSPAV